MTALTRAITHRHWRQAKLLIEVGSDVNWRGENKRTPLMEVCFLDNEQKAAGLAKMLLENGANLGLVDEQGLTALSYAILLKRGILFSLFTEYVDFDLNFADLEGNTALFHAITVGNPKVVKVLVQKLKHYGLSVDTINRKGETSLIHALKLGRLECADILIEEGKASVEVRDLEQHKSALEFRKELQLGRKRFLASSFALLDQRQTIKPKTPRKLRSISSATCKQNGATLPKITSSKIRPNKCRPFTAPERIFVSDFFKPCTPIKEDLLRLYSIYNQQVSASYRKGYKHVPLKKLPTLTEQTFEEEEHEKKEEQENEKSEVSNNISTKIKGLAKLSKNKRLQGQSSSSSPSQSSGEHSGFEEVSKKTGRPWPKPTQKGIKALGQNFSRGTEL